MKSALSTVFLLLLLSGSCIAQNTNTHSMQQQLLSEIISADSNSKVLVIFGGNPQRRHEVIALMSKIKGLTAYGTLSEAEGMDRLQNLPHVDLVLIGGRYDEAQRARIRTHVKRRMPGTQMTEPGYDYPYDNAAIEADVRRKLGL
jgi:hypothetical protein